MPSRVALLALFWLSGAAGLALEVVWMRRLHLLFGGTALAVAAVTAAFMAGLGLGSVLAGRRGDQSTRPLWWYGIFEIGIAIYALAIPVLLDLALPIYAVFGGWFAGMPLLLDAVRFALAFLILAPATTAMGATLPLLVRHLSTGGDVGASTGLLYAANTAGALAGVCLAGYILLPEIGEAATTSLAAGIDLTVGVGAIIWALKSRPLTPTEPIAGTTTLAPPAMPLALTLVGVTGFASLACQVAWSRVIALLLGSSVYAFTCIVAAVLAGISLGSALSSRLPDRWARGHTGALAATALLASLLVLGGSAAMNRLPWIVYDLVLLAGPDGYWWVQLAVASILILPASICFGAAPPLAIRALDPDAQSASRWVGRTWAANTLGALIGAGSGGLLLVPWLGVRPTLLLAAAITTIAAVVVLRRHARGGWAGAVGVAIAAALILLPGAWSPNLLGSQPYLLAGSAQTQDDIYQSADEYRRHQSDAMRRPLSHEEGSSATVTVMEDPLNLVLEVDGKPDASSMADMDTQLLLAHIPMLLHPAPKRVMVIGLGSGVTVGAAALHPGAHVTAVEIEPAVVRAAPWFAHVNHDVLNRDNVEVVIEDARTVLVTDDRRWDVVISEPSNPWLSGPAKLFTREFFEQVKGRLGERGVFGQWVHVYGLEAEHLRAIVRTFRLVFPDARLFVTIDQADLVLVGGSGVGPVDWESIDLRARHPVIGAELIGTGAGGVAGICSRYLAGPNECVVWTGEGPLNTDDNGFVEYGAGRRGWQKRKRDAMLDALSELDPDPRPLVGSGTAQWPAHLMLAAMAEAAAARGDGFRANRFARVGLELHESAAGHRALGTARDAGVAGLDAETAYRRALELDPDDSDARVALAGHLLSSGDHADALEMLPEPRATTDEGRLLRAAALEGVGRSVEAHALFQALPIEAFDSRHLDAFEWAGRAAVGAKDYAAAEPRLRVHLARKPIAPRALLLLIRALRLSGQTAAAERLRAELAEAEAFMQERDAELAAFYKRGIASVTFLREGVRRHPFDPALAARLIEELRLRVTDDGGPRESKRIGEVLEVGRKALTRHPGSYPLAVEHAYGCAWIASESDPAQGRLLYAEAADVLERMLTYQTRLPRERRRESLGRAARYRRLAAGH